MLRSRKLRAALAALAVLSIVLGLWAFWIEPAWLNTHAMGHIVEDGRHLFVGGGVGTSILPVRFRVPPEVVALELR